MQYHLTEEQAQIRDVVTAYLADHYDHEARLRILASPERWSPELWRAFAEDLGILGLGAPEAAGGLGGGQIDHMLIMEALGGALVVEPYLETCVIAAGVLVQSETALARALLEGVVAGTVRFAFADLESHARQSPTPPRTCAGRDGTDWVLNGAKSPVVGLPGASHILLTAHVSGAPGSGSGTALFAVAADHPALRIRPGRSIDGRTLSGLFFADLKVGDDACVIGVDRGSDVLAATLDAAIAALCAEAVGLMRRLIADTLAYLEQRKQFGAFLADFQVLQHRLADMQTDYEEAQAMAYFAAGMLEAPAARRQVAVAAAKARVSVALRRVAQEAVQMHGAMGMTDELPIGHMFRRATVLENQFGSVDYQMSRLVAGGSDTSGMAAG